MEAGAEAGVRHQARGASAGDPCAGRQSDRNVFTRRGNIGQGGVSLEHRDQILDQRARHAGEEVESLPLEEQRERSPGHRHRVESSAACRAEVHFESWHTDLVRADRLTIARALREMAGLLAVSGQAPFKARAYARGAEILERLDTDLGELVEARRLTTLPGIGAALAAMITELYQTGRSQALEEQRQRVPAVALELSRIPRLGRDQIAVLAEAVSRDKAAFEGRLATGLPVRVHVAPRSSYATTLLRATGSKAHVQHLERLAAERGVRLAGESEEAIYRRLGMPFILPELREGEGEIEAAISGDLPADLVTAADLRGFVHCHTVFSDGQHTVEQMARAADALGMEYMTITDHSPSAAYAGGLTVDRLKAQWEEIARVQETVSVRLLRGTESDILADGRLDYPDAILERLDVVIASIHRRHRMDANQMTDRLVRTMTLPCFKIWGHALGRLILSRPPVECRVEEVLDAARAGRAAIEINGDPRRLDLAPRWLRAARERGLSFVVSTDAHSMAELGNVRYGVAMARRGWVRRGDVLNTRTAQEFARAVAPTGRA